MSKCILIIDAHDLSKKKLRSLGILLREILPLMALEYKLVLLSDVYPIKDYLPIEVYDVVVRGKPLRGVKDFLLDYYSWMKRKVEKISKYNRAVFWEIRNYVPLRLNVPSVVTIHDLYPLFSPKKSFIRKRIFYHYILATLENSTLIVTPTFFTKRELARNYNDFSDDRVKVVYNPIPTLSEQGNVPLKLESKQYFLFIGRLSYWKGTDILLDLAEFSDINVPIVLAGLLEDDFLRRRIEYLSDTGKIIYLGYVSDAEKEYLIRNAEVFVYPSRYDGFGIPPLEAIVRGTVTVMSNIDVLVEVTMGLGNYFDINSGWNALYEAILNSYSCKDKIEFMKNMFLSVYSVESYARNMCSVFHKAMNMWYES